MNKPSEHIQIFDSQTIAYEQAFDVFLAHTNQKTNMRRWLDKFIADQVNGPVFIDVGAGNGIVTQWFAPKFSKTIATEPNEFLRKQLKKALPKAEILPHTILDTQLEPIGDFILCSHIFYYIPKEEWLENLEKLLSWLSPKGKLVIVLQDHHTDCMRMLEHFFGEAYDLHVLVEQFDTIAESNKYHANIIRDKADIIAEDFATAYTITEFMLNLTPIKEAPLKNDVCQYIEKHFKLPNGGYHMSCNQAFLVISKK